MTDDLLIALAQHWFEQVDRTDATDEDYRQFRDIFPVVLQRLREKVEITRDFAARDGVATEGPKGWEKQATVANRQADQDQMQLSLLHI
ncbi:MAG: hypothetical protein QM681_02610 [Novosphingobium sp.]